MFNSLSNLQKELVFDKTGKIVVRACPGSGKTYSISAKFAYMDQKWKFNNSGIAAISFTNVAWKEIEKNLYNNFEIRTPVGYPHFLGTIDSFINKFIFLPYGHHIMECDMRPTLVGEPHGIWTSGRYERDYEKYFDKTSFDINDELVPTSNLQQFHFKWTKNNDGSINGHVKNVRDVKKKYWKQGYATQDDANYIALKLLGKYSQIAESIVNRFPQFVIDEAQDTSKIQMNMIDLLISNGLENIMLVGDPDQAIFEWKDAKPELFTQKFNEWKGNSIILNENRRSSKKICNFTCNLSSLEKPSIAVNAEVKDFDINPIIQTYDKAHVNRTINNFLELCKEHCIEINEKNVAVIYRSKEFYNQITGLSNVSGIDYPWITGHMITKELVHGKYIYDNVNPREGFKMLEKAIYKVHFRTNYCSQSSLTEQIERIGFTKYRNIIYRLINCLPKTDCSLSQWVNEANQIFKERNIRTLLKINHEKGDTSIKEFFKPFVGDINLGYRTGTVHTTKGETFEAVLLLLKRKGSSGAYYKTLLNRGTDTTENEELRIAYVGMTRPRQLLVLAVPTEEDKVAWGNRMQIGL